MEKSNWSKLPLYNLHLLCQAFYLLVTIWMPKTSTSAVPKPQHLLSQKNTSAGSVSCKFVTNSPTGGGQNHSVCKNLNNPSCYWEKGNPLPAYFDPRERITEMLILHFLIAFDRRLLSLVTQHGDRLSIFEGGGSILLNQLSIWLQGVTADLAWSCAAHLLDTCVGSPAIKVSNFFLLLVLSIYYCATPIRMFSPWEILLTSPRRKPEVTNYSLILKLVELL